MSKTGYIYSITNDIEGTVYIGSTIQNRIEDRWYEHKRCLINHEHTNWKLTRGYSHYEDINKFIFIKEQIIEFEDYQELLEIEGIEIRKIPEDWSLNIDRHPELGFIKGPESPFDFTGRFHKEESKLRIGYSNSKRRYNVIDPNGMLFFVKSMRAYCRDKQLHLGGMLKVANNKQSNYKGYRCWYSSEEEIKKYTSSLQSYLWVELELTGLLWNFTRKQVKEEKYKLHYYGIISPDNRLFISDNLNKFSKDFGLQQTTMTRVARGKQESCLGWKVYYLEKSIFLKYYVALKVTPWFEIFTPTF